MLKMLGRYIRPSMNSILCNGYLFFLYEESVTSGTYSTIFMASLINKGALTFKNSVISLLYDLTSSSIILALLRKFVTCA